MKFPRKYTLKELADFLNIRKIGPDDFPVFGINEIHRVQAGDIVFVDHSKYYKKALESKATIILINQEVDCPENKALLISKNPFSDFNKLTAFFSPFQKASSLISPTAQVGKNSIIQPGSFIGNNVQIGENCIIHANVSIYDNTIIGNHVHIHSGTVIGANAFYYKKRETYYDQLLSSGNVTIEDDVHIGANCTIDKGVTSQTIIGKGSKLDNQIQIGHDTQIGENCLIASLTGIAGCVTIKDNVTIWGQVGIASGFTIGENTVIMAKSGVGKDLEPNNKYFGIPADNARTKYKELAAIKQIPDLMDSVKNILK